MSTIAQRSAIAPSQDDRANYRHFVMDIAWFGLALPAASRFLSVYAIRLGATPLELGWLSSLPAIVLLFSAAMSGWWRTRFANSRHAIFWPAVVFRLIFLLPVLAPLFPQEWQVTWLILSVSLPALMQGVAGVIFVALLRESIDEKRITPLVGTRTVVMNVTVAVAGLAFGFWLERAAFPNGYQVMFLLAFLLAMMSFWHVQRVKVPSLPVMVMLTQSEPSARPWRSPGFRKVALAAALTHIPFLFAVPLVTLRLVEDLGAAEGFMSIYSLAELSAAALVAWRVSHIIKRFGNRTVISVSMAGTSLGLLVLAAAANLEVTLIAGALMGGCWTSATIALFDYFCEVAPKNETTRYTTAYHQTIFVATFIGPMLGSGLANMGVALVTVLLIGAGLRLLGAILIQNEGLSNPVRKRINAFVEHRAAAR